MVENPTTLGRVKCVRCGGYVWDEGYRLGPDDPVFLLQHLHRGCARIMLRDLSERERGAPALAVAPSR